MKIALNKEYGGFGIPDIILEELKKDDEKRWKWAMFTDDLRDRTDEKLISLFEKFISAHPDSEVRIIDIPNDRRITDMSIYEYDGKETLIYVVDGKLHYA